MQKIIVTGGLGFIGSNFIRLLLHENLCAEILNIDKQTYAGNPENLAEFENDRRYVFLKADIGNVEKIENAINQFKPTSIVNFAAESHVDRSIDSPEPFIQTNVLGTLRLLESTKNFFNSLDEKSKNKFRFLHISTDEVYGSLSNEDPAFSESTGYSPNSPYSASKAGADHLVRAYFHTFGLPVLTTNCSNNYGPYQFPEKLIPLVILNALEGKKLPIYGDGKNIRDWLHVEDHCRGIYSVLQRGLIGETYCIGGDSEKTNLEVVDTICEALDNYRNKNAPHGKLKEFVKDRPGHDQRYAINFSKIKNELGWAPNYSFEEGMRNTVDWYFKNLEWCENVTSGKYRRERLGSK